MADCRLFVIFRRSSRALELFPLDRNPRHGTNQSEGTSPVDCSPVVVGGGCDVIRGGDLVDLLSAPNNQKR